MLSRRRFLARSTGAAVAGFLYPGLRMPFSGSDTAEAATSIDGLPVYRMLGPDPTYAGGEVVAMSNNSFVLESGAGVRTVSIDPGAVVWKEIEGGPDLIQMQDWVDVKGNPLPDGSLGGTSGMIFVNIGRRDGIVNSATPTSVSVTGARGVEDILLSDVLEVILPDGSPHPQGFAALAPGAPVGMVGIRLQDGTFRATRIWTD